MELEYQNTNLRGWGFESLRVYKLKENVMKIVINNSKTINIIDQCLVVKNNKLFNIMTNQYEGIDGDLIEFITLDSKGEQTVVTGVVKGYTCNRRIELKGVNCLYATVNGTGKNITHVSSITETDCKYEEEMKAEIEKEMELEFAEMAL